MRTLLIALAAALAVAGGAHAAGTKQIKDWLGVCANTGACTAFGFAAEEDETGAYLIIQRDAGPAAQPKVTIVSDVAEKQPSAVWRFTLDGHPIPGVGPVQAAGSDAGVRAQLEGQPAAAMIAALRNGQSLQFASGGKSVGEISLAGSAAILLWVDDHQGRVGTVTALGRPGANPASTVPPPVSPPLIAAAAAVDQSGVPAHAPRSMIKGVEDCDLDPSVTDPNDIVARLAPGLMLWGPECEMGAYNELSVFFLGDEHGGNLRRISFPEPPGSDQAKDDLLINAEFDPKTQTMAAFSKARGIGDCGAATNWIWDGKAFQVVYETIMPACRGVLSDDWPPLFISRQK
jgi:hypothetical protein